MLSPSWSSSLYQVQLPLWADHLVRGFPSLPSSSSQLCYKIIISIWRIRNEGSERLSNLANMNSTLLTCLTAPSTVPCSESSICSWDHVAVDVPLILIQERYPVWMYFLHLLSLSYEEGRAHLSLLCQLCHCTTCIQLHSGFPGGEVVKNPPANAGDTGSSPGPGRSHVPWSN